MGIREIAEMQFNKSTMADTQRGITGLETAIILIAFVVVASVFAFTVLSTGIFASERSKETVFSGLEEAKSSIEPRGSVIAYKANRGGTDTIYKVSWVVSNAVSGEPVDLTPPYLEGGTGTDPDEDTGAEYKTVISYIDQNQYLSDVPWTVDWVGNSNADSLLEEGEKAEITVWLLNRATATAISDAASTGWSVADNNGAHGMLVGSTLIGTNDQFTLEMKPESGAVLTMQRTAPSRLDTIMDLK
jgi:archaeal flagellin FlaB